MSPQDDENAPLLYVDLSPCGGVQRSSGFSKKRAKLAESEVQRVHVEGCRESDKKAVDNGGNKPLRRLDLNTLNPKVSQAFRAKLSSRKLSSVVKGSSKPLKRAFISQENDEDRNKIKKGAGYGNKEQKASAIEQLKSYKENVPTNCTEFKCEGKISPDLGVTRFDQILTRAERSLMDLSASNPIYKTHLLFENMTDHIVHSKEIMSDETNICASLSIKSVQHHDAEFSDLTLSILPPHYGVSDPASSDPLLSQMCFSLEKKFGSKKSLKDTLKRKMMLVKEASSFVLNDSRLCEQESLQTEAGTKMQGFGEPGIFGVFKPGIMNKVRSSKQVGAFLEAILKLASESSFRSNTLESIDIVKGQAADAEHGCHCTEPLLETQMSHRSQNMHILEQMDEAKHVTFAQGSINGKAISELERKDGFTEDLHQVTENISEDQEGKLKAFCHKDKRPSCPGELPPYLPRTRETASNVFTCGKLVEECSVCTCNGENIQEGAPGKCSEQTKVLDLNKDMSCSMDADHHKELDGAENYFTQAQQPLAFPDKCSGSNTATDVASQWLDLLGLDIKGRLSALKRSRRRVRSFIMSGQLDSDPGNILMSGKSANHASVSMPSSFESENLTELGNFGKIEHELQMNRWRSLFISMDSVLSMEAEKLVSWLKNIQKMQAHCCGATTQKLQQSQLPLFSAWVSSRQTVDSTFIATMAMQQELAQIASAASISSTANFAKRMQGVLKTVAV